MTSSANFLAAMAGNLVSTGRHRRWAGVRPHFSIMPQYWRNVRTWPELSLGSCELRSQRLSVEACVNAVCQLAQGPRFQDTSTSRSDLADKLLEAKISSALAEQISVAMAPLGVAVSVANDRVTLAGMTCSGSMRSRAEKVAQAAAGVFQIDNRIVCMPARG